MILKHGVDLCEAVIYIMIQLLILYKSYKSD
jgi:hypothetical protein